MRFIDPHDPCGELDPVLERGRYDQIHLDQLASCQTNRYNQTETRAADLGYFAHPTQALFATGGDLIDDEVNFVIDELQTPEKRFIQVPGPDLFDQFFKGAYGTASTKGEACARFHALFLSAIQYAESGEELYLCSGIFPPVGTVHARSSKIVSLKASESLQHIEWKINRVVRTSAAVAAPDMQNA